MPDLLETMNDWLDTGNEFSHLFSSRDGHTIESWLASNFHVYDQPTKITNRLSDVMLRALATKNHEILVRCLSLTGMLRSYAMWGTTVQVFDQVRRDPDFTGVSSVIHSAISALLNIELAESLAGCRHETTLEFWHDLMTDVHYTLAGFEGLRNHHLPTAFYELGKLLALLGEVSKSRLAQTLRGMRRDAQRRGVDVFENLKLFFEQESRLSPAQRALLDEVFGTEFIADAQEAATSTTP